MIEVMGPLLIYCRQDRQGNVRRLNAIRAGERDRADLEDMRKGIPWHFLAKHINAAWQVEPARDRLELPWWFSAN